MSTVNSYPLVKVQEELRMQHVGGGKSSRYKVQTAEATAEIPSADGKTTIRREVESNILKDGQYRTGYHCYKDMIFPQTDNETQAPTLADGRTVIGFTISRQVTSGYFSLQEGLNKDMAVEMIISEQSHDASSPQNGSETGRFSVVTWRGDATLCGSRGTGGTLTFHSAKSSDEPGASEQSSDVVDLNGLKINIPGSEGEESRLRRHVPLPPRVWGGFCLYTEEGASRPAMEGVTRGTATATYWYPEDKLRFVGDSEADSA